MRSRQGNPLATMLIISAVDVLLCAFTATVTLFFIGAGASQHNKHMPGWGGVLVYTSTTPGVVLESDFPNVRVANTAMVRLTATPTDSNPATFRVRSAVAGRLSVDI